MSFAIAAHRVNGHHRSNSHHGTRGGHGTTLLNPPRTPSRHGRRS